MHSTSHAIWDAARYLWIGYAILAVPILYLSWFGRTRWPKRLLLVQLLLAVVPATAYLWFPETSHDIGYDLLGALLWTGIALGVTAVTAVLALVFAAGRPEERGLGADPSGEGRGPD